MTRDEELSYALLWLRNHYELMPHGESPEVKRQVLVRIDKVLADGPPITGKMGDEFRTKYPRIYPRSKINVSLEK